MNGDDYDVISMLPNDDETLNYSSCLMVYLITLMRFDHYYFVLNVAAHMLFLTLYQQYFRIDCAMTTSSNSHTSYLRIFCDDQWVWICNKEKLHLFD